MQTIQRQFRASLGLLMLFALLSLLPSAPMYAATSKPDAVSQIEAPASFYPCMYSGDRPILRNGSRGPAVQQAQCLFNRTRWHPDLRNDGIFGSATEYAILYLQRCARRNGINITVDGIIGPDTWHLLYNTPFWC